MGDTHLINIYSKHDLDQPLGYVEVDSLDVTLDQIRRLMEEELEGLPSSWRFLLLNEDKTVRMSTAQEPKKTAESILKAFGRRGLLISENVQTNVPLGSSPIEYDRERDRPRNELFRSNSERGKVRGSILHVPQAAKQARSFWRNLESGTSDGESQEDKMKLQKALGISISQPIPIKQLSDSIDLEKSGSESTIFLSSAVGKSKLITSPVITDDPFPSDDENSEVEDKSEDQSEKSEAQSERSEVQSVQSEVQSVQSEEVLERDDGIRIRAAMRSPSTRIANIDMQTSIDILSSIDMDSLPPPSSMKLRSFTIDQLGILDHHLANRPAPLTLLNKNILQPEHVQQEGATPAEVKEGLISRFPNISTMAPNRKSFITITRKSSLVEMDDLSWRTEGGTKHLTDFTLEQPEKYEFYYRNNFTDKVHINFLGVHPKLGPIIVSILRAGPDGVMPAIIRTDQGDHRVFVDSVRKAKGSKDYLKLLKNSFPDKLSGVKFVPITDDALTRDLITFENTQIIANVKVGIIFCNEDQVTDDDMFGNQRGSPQYDKLLELLGDKVTLKGWDGYSGGLDVKRDSTGTHSVYTKYNGVEIMFHVPTLIPYTPNDPQQVERKRHVGNDVVILVFKHGDTPFSPSVIKSQFNHVFVVVQPVGSAAGRELQRYKVAVVSKRGVPPFGPQVPAAAYFEHDSHFRDFLLKKMLNGERAAMAAPIFARKLLKARRDLLQNMVNSTYASMDESPKIRSSLSYVPSKDKDIHRSVNMQVTVVCRDVTVKTAIDSSDLVQTLSDKLSKKMPESRHGYGLWNGDRLMDPEAQLSSYSDGRNSLSLEMRPMDSNYISSAPVEPKKRNKFGSIGKMVAKKESIPISEPVFVRTGTSMDPLSNSPRTERLHSMTDDHIVSVRINTHADFTLDTRVSSSSKMSALRDKLQGNINSSDDCYFWINGKKVTMEQTVSECIGKDISSTKRFVIFFGPHAPKKK